MRNTHWVLSRTNSQLPFRQQFHEGHSLNDNQWHRVMVKRRNRDIQIFIDNERPRNGKILSAPFRPNSRIQGHSGPEVCGLQRRSSRPNIRRRSFLVYDCRLLAYLHEMAHSARLAGGVRSPPMHASNVAPSGAGWVEGRPRCRAVLCRRRLTEWPSAVSATCADFFS